MRPGQVRRLGQGDADAVAALFRESRAAAMPWLPVLHTPEQDRAFFTRELAQAAGWGLGNESGRLIGFAVVGDGWLRHLYVSTGSTRQGVGRRLLEAAVDGGAVQLWVFAANTAARAFYQAQGFVEVERTDGAGNEEGLPDVRMARTATRPPHPPQ